MSVANLVKKYENGLELKTRLGKKWEKISQKSHTWPRTVLIDNSRSSTLRSASSSAFESARRIKKPCLTAIVYFFVLNAAGRLELVLLEAPGARRRGMPRNFVFIDVQIRILPWFSISQILESSLISIGARSHFRSRNRRRLRLQLRRQSAATIGSGSVFSMWLHLLKNMLQLLSVPRLHLLQLLSDRRRLRLLMLLVPAKPLPLGGEGALRVLLACCVARRLATPDASASVLTFWIRSFQRLLVVCISEMNGSADSESGSRPSVDSSSA